MCKSVKAGAVGHVKHDLQLDQQSLELTGRYDTMTSRSNTHPLARILDLITRFSSCLSALALVSILFLTLREVAMRYFLNAPSSWASEANQWFFALAVMLVIPEIARTNGHIAISVLLDRMPHKKRDIAFRIIAVLSFLMCLAACYVTSIETLRQYSFGIQTVWVNPIPKWWISIVIPFGFLLTALQFLRLGVMPTPEKKHRGDN